MKRKLRIALVAHDNRKVDIIDWVIYNSDFLSHHSLVCTGTTGTLVQEALASKGVNPEMQIMTSGPLGGDAEIAAMVVRKEIDLAVFLIDDLNAQPHEADIMITTDLWDDESYEPMNPHYERFDREKHEANIKKYM